MKIILGTISVLMAMLAAAAGELAGTSSLDDDSPGRSVGQMIIVGFYGSDNRDPRFHHIIDDLESGIIGECYFLPATFSQKWI